MSCVVVPIVQVYGVVWNNFLKDRDGQGRETIVPGMFVTYGVKHLKFWTQEFDQVGSAAYMSPLSAI